MLLKRNPVMFSILILVCISTNAQNFTKKIEGRVQSETMEVSGVHIINSTSKKATITDINGYFTISAKLNDTIRFSGIQYEKSTLIVNNKVLESEIITVTLKETITELEEVVVTPYNLSGDIKKDIQALKIEPLVTSTSLELPNADVKSLTLNERKLFLAMEEQLLHKLIDEISGHNKRLRNMVALDQAANQIETVKKFYSDTLYIQRLKLSPERIDDFMYFCAVDSIFNATIESQDKLKIWEFLKKKSSIYRKNNNF